MITVIYNRPAFASSFISFRRTKKALADDAARWSINSGVEWSGQPAHAVYPDFIYSIFGATLAAGGVFADREYAASMMGNIMLTWFARDAQESDARWAVILAFCVYDVVGFIITLIAIFSGSINSLGWLIVLIYLFFAVGFAYFLVPRKMPATEAN